MKRVFAAVFLAALLPTLASAQQHALGESGYLGARVGAVLPKHDDLEGFDNGFSFEAVIGRRVSPNLALEASLGRFGINASGSFFDPDTGVTFDAEMDISAIPLTASVKAIAPLDQVELYGLLGAGLYFLSSEIRVTGGLAGSASDDATALGLHLGGGFAAHVSPQVKLGAELKYVMGSAKLFDSSNHFDSMLIGGSLGFVF